MSKVLEPVFEPRKDCIIPSLVSRYRYQLPLGNEWGGVSKKIPECSMKIFWKFLQENSRMFQLPLAVFCKGVSGHIAVWGKVVGQRGEAAGILCALVSAGDGPGTATWPQVRTEPGRAGATGSALRPGGPQGPGRVYLSEVRMGRWVGETECVQGVCELMGM